MPAVYSHRLVVPPGAIDANGHVNNVQYVQWMQDAAIEHSAAQGWSMERYREIGASWVARSHFVEYLRPAFARDEIVIETWVADFGRARSRRRYRFRRQADGAVVARAETQWTFVDMETGKPRPAPEAVVGAFEIVADGSALVPG